jgi:uroporphyrinogen-III synthase
VSGPAPLSGRRVVVTHGAGKNGELTTLLVGAGAGVEVIPMIETQRLLAADAVRRGIAPAASGVPGTPGGGRCGWVVFTSATAVPIAVEAAADLLARSHLAAVGEATAAALRSHGLTVDLVPAEASADALAEALAEWAAGDMVVVLGAEGGRDVIAPRLRRAGATVELVILYRSVVPEGAVDRLRAALATAPDAVVFSSGSAVRHTSMALDGARPPATTVAVCIGSTTAVAARGAGWPEVLVAPEATATALVSTLQARLLGGHPVP